MSTTKNFADECSHKIQDLLLPFLRDAKEETILHIRQLIKNSLESQGWVTREMFDVQKALLAKTRLKLEAMEKNLSSTERRHVTDTHQKK